MESYIADWLNLLFRWIHLIAGAAWIGTSFYFNWLNHNIRPPAPPERPAGGAAGGPAEAQDTIAGELFAIHGGHFYRVSKYAGAPARLPETLHWFKWEAYLTWITGLCLLLVVYYWNAKLYLIDPSVRAWEPWQAVSAALASLAGGWVIYHALCRALTRSPRLLAALVLALVAGAAWGFSELFGARAAYIHVGAMIGTIMAGNVFFVIIPNQRKMVDAMLAGQPPNTALGDAGALRSLHNNYLTLPVLFIMVSNHFPMTYGGSGAWLTLVAISVIGAGARHYFNLKHKGRHAPWLLPAAALALVALAFVLRPTPRQVTPARGAVGAVGAETSETSASAPTYAQVEAILKARCTTCHATHPTFPGFAAPPQGISYESPAQVKAVAEKIRAVAVEAQIMPPGNLTQITPEERATLGAWIAAGAHIPGE
jgi:uncharacterized membrane protein